MQRQGPKDAKIPVRSCRSARYFWSLPISLPPFLSTSSFQDSPLLGAEVPAGQGNHRDRPGKSQTGWVLGRPGCPGSHWHINTSQNESTCTGRKEEGGTRRAPKTPALLTSRQRERKEGAQGKDMAGPEGGLHAPKAWLHLLAPLHRPHLSGFRPEPHITNLPQESSQCGHQWRSHQGTYCQECSQRC